MLIWVIDLARSRLVVVVCDLLFARSGLVWVCGLLLLLAVVVVV